MMDERWRGLLDVAGSVLGELDLEVVVDRVLESARELTGARYAALGVLDSSRTGLERFITAGVDEQLHARIGVQPRGRGVLGELIRDPVPLRLAEVGEHSRSYGFPLDHPPMHTFLGVPVLVADVPFGSLYLTEKAGGGEFSERGQAIFGAHWECRAGRAAGERAPDASFDGDGHGHPGIDAEFGGDPRQC